MSAQVALRAHLNELLDSAAKDRADEAPEAWANLEKLVRTKFGSEEDAGLACQILFAPEDALPSFVADTVRYKEQGTSRTGHAKTREAIYKWLDVFLRGLSPQRAAASAAGAVETVAVYGFRREADNYARAASLLPLQAGLELKLPPWPTDRGRAQQLAEQLQGVYLRDRKASETVRAGVLEALGLLVEVAPQGAFTGTFTPPWLLEECRSTLTRIAKSGKPQAMLAAGALAGLSGAFSACKEEDTGKVVDTAWGFFASTIASADSLKRYQGLRSALRMMALQTARFRMQLIANWESTLDTLTTLSVHSNRDIRAAATDALSACLREVGQAMSAPDATKEVQAQILGHFTQQLMRPALSQRETAVAVEVVGALAASTSRFFGEQGLQKVSEYLVPLGQRGALAENDSASAGEASASEIALLKTLALVASELPSVPDATLQQCMSIAERLAGAYPTLWPKQRSTIDAAFVGMLGALSTKQGVLSSLLPRLVASLLAHTLRPADTPVTAGADRPGQGTEEAWKLYLPLWTSIIDSKGQSADKDAAASAWAQQTYDALMSAVLDALRNLDTDYQQDESLAVGANAAQTIDSKRATDGEAALDVDVGVGLQPHNVADMRAFLSLSAFLTEVLPLLGPGPFKGWGEAFCTELIAGSKRRPLLSGYYRLMEMALQLCSRGNLLASDREFSQIVAAWLLEVSVLVRRYKDELLSAVLDLLLSAPSTIFPAQELLRPLQLALRLGLQHPPLADRTLMALERLESHSPEALHHLAPKLMPLVEPYLAPVRSIAAATAIPATEGGDPSDDANTTEDGGGEAAGEAAKRVKEEAEAALRRAADARMEGLAAVQPKMQAWLGRLGSWADALALGPVAVEQEQDISKRWDAKDMIGLKVSFPGMETSNPVLCLDSLLPLAADLAEKSTERAVRVAACEFMHASILWMVGTNARRPLTRDAQDFAAQPTQFHAIFQRVLPVALRLACGPEPVARQLFEPLVMALVHWFTRAACREAAETMALLDAVLEGLTDNQNGALRDLCAAATKEFLVWSAKHIPASRDAAKAAGAENMNAASLLRRLFDRMAHPEPYQRLGACLAMKHCAEALAKEPGLADAYMLQSLHQVMLALRAAESDPAGTGTRQLAAEAMQELVRQLYRRPKITSSLMDPSPARTGIPGIDGFLLWLWPLTAAPQRSFRANAMWLHKHLAALQSSGRQAGVEPSEDTPAAHWLKGMLGARQRSANQEAVSFTHMAQMEPPGPTARPWIQELEGKLHWAVWAVEMGMLKPSDLAEAVDSQAMDAAAAILSLYEQLGRERPRKEGVFVGMLAGCERDVQRLSTTALTYLSRCSNPSDVLATPGACHLLLSALLEPEALGIPHLEDQSCRSVAMQAKTFLEVAAKRNSGALRAFKQALADRLDAMPMLRADAKVDSTAATLLSAADGSSVAAVRGLTALAEAALPSQISLLPDELSNSLPDRLLDIASSMCGKLSPRQQVVMEGALNLALRLGLPANTLLTQLLHQEGGASLYQAYRRAVTTWVLWNAGSICQPLCQALCGAAQQAADMAQRVLSGTLEALQRGSAAGHSDPRTQSFLGALLSHWHITKPLTEPAAPMDKRLIWLRLLRQLLGLNAAAVLRPAQQSSAFLLNSYLSILNFRDAAPEQRGQATQVRIEALQLLAPFLALPADMAGRVHAAVERVVSDFFPTFSQELPRGSTQATEYTVQLLAILDAAVQAAASGTHVLAVLEALLPVIREMGMPNGHARQSSLEARLAIIAAAPWTDGTGEGMKGSDKAAAGQATSLLRFAWGYVFEAPMGTLGFIEIRRAMLRYVLLPALRFASLAFQVSALQERAPKLRGVLSRSPEAAPSLMSDEEAGLFAREAAYAILQQMYTIVPPATIKDRILAAVGGNKDVTIWAMKDVRELAASSDALEGSARSARCAAFATAAACIAATQDKEALFANPLKMPSKAADPTGPWPRLLDVDRTVRLPVVLDNRGQARRAAGGIREVTERIRAQRAGVTQSTLGTLSSLGSLSATASLTDKLTSSQYALEGAEFEAPSISAGDSAASKHPEDQGILDTQENIPEATDVLLYEDDELDTNPCMLPLVRFIEKAASLYQPETAGMPAWMSLLHGSIASDATPLYARLFLVKAVLHVEARHTARIAAAAEQTGAVQPEAIPSIFGRFAAEWFPAMTNVLISNTQAPQEAGVHYMLLDACVTFLGWDSLFPVPPKQEVAVQLMDYLVRAAYSEDHSVQRNNISLVKAFASKWPTTPPQPKALLLHICAGGPQGASDSAKGRLPRHVAERRAFGLRLATVGLLYSQAKVLLGLPSASELAHRIINALAMHGGQRFASQAGETAGLLLRQLHRLGAEAQDSLSMSAEDADTDMHRSLVTMFNSRPDMALCSLERLSAHHSRAVDSLQSHIVAALPSAAGLFKSMALGTLARRAAHLPDLLSELRPHLKRLLVGQSEALQAAATALLEALLPKEPDSEAGWVLDILLGAVDFTRCPSKTVRQHLFGILRDAWQLRPSLQARLRPPLMAMLGDADAEIQGNVLAFWHSALPRTLSGRLAALLCDNLDMATSWRERLEGQWPHSASRLLLRLSADERAYDAPIFDTELAECKFTEYPVDTWSKATLAVAPLFSATWEAAASQSTSQDAFGGAHGPGFAMTQGQAGLVRATQAGAASLSLNLTLPADGGTQALVPAGSPARAGPVPGGGGSSLASGSSLSPQTRIYRRVNRFRGTNTSLAALARRREELKRGEVAARENKVALFRKYRTGELPDIQRVSIAAFLGPLETIVANSSAAQQVITAMFKVVKTSQPSALPPVRKGLALCFEREPRAVAYVGALQRLAIEDRGGAVDAAEVATAAIESGSLQCGALQLEEAMLFGKQSGKSDAQPAAKRRRAAASVSSEPEVAADEATWAALARVYMQLGESHLAHVACSAHLARCPGTRQAMSAAAERRTLTAYTLYEGLMRAVSAGDPNEAMDIEGSEALTPQLLLGGQEPSPEEEDLWFRERSRCMEEMGDWAKVLEVIDSENAETAAADGESAAAAEVSDERLFLREDGWDGPKFLRAFVRACLFQPGERSRLDSLVSSASAEADQMGALQRAVPVELAIHAASSGSWDRCQAAVEAAWQSFKETWGDLHPLSTPRRLEALAQLQPLAELQESVHFVRGLSHPSSAPRWQGIVDLTAGWRSRWPSMQQGSSAAALTIINSRDILLQSIAAELAQKAHVQHEEVTALRAQMAVLGAAALQRQGFLDAAQEILVQYRGSAGSGAAAVTAEAELSIALTQAEYSQSNLSRQHLEQRLTAFQATPPAHAERGDVQRRSVLEARAQHFLHPRDVKVVQKAIEVYEGASAMDTAQASVEEAGKASMQLAHLCDNLLKEMEMHEHGAAKEAPVGRKLDADASSILVSSMLQALRLGGPAGVEAQLMVPRALTVLESSKSAQQAWLGAWGSISLHVLLPWAAQMLSLLGSSEGAALLPALKELARRHKQRLYFPFTLSQQHYSQAGHERAAELRPLMQSPLLDTWAASLNDMTYPAQRWQAWVSRLDRLLSSGKTKEAAKLYVAEVYPDMVGRHKGRAERGRSGATTYSAQAAAKLDKVLQDAFGSEGSKMVQMDERAFKRKAQEVRAAAERLTEGLSGRRDLVKLSPWLAEYSSASGEELGELLLMPWMPSMGRLAGSLPPDVHVVSFGKTVSVFSSKQKPKELTVYGSDFRTYKWIVKGGEDVRTDERMEVILDVCNGLMARHPGAASHRLKVRTYDVVPVSSSLGLVEFVPGTQPLKAAIATFIDAQVEGQALEQHSVNIADLAKGTPARQDLHGQYLGSFHASDEAVASKFHAVEAKLRWDALREALLRQAGGPEEFLAMRASYAASLAAVSITGYITGAGDRHLENFLLHTASGTLIPIDFGYSFGTGAQVLPIPELMPFRLTRQMRGALQPHDACALLRLPCALGMAALRAGAGILEGILGIFLREPLLDWQREGRLLKDARVGDTKEDSGAEDYHIAAKIQNARDKLQGKHPSDILLAELAPKHSSTKHWAALQAVVKGNPKTSRRARVAAGEEVKRGLIPEEQVDCLLDQATDVGILGRTWAGWRPFV